ncbi:Structural maintenance of chromosomes protein 6 [Candida viswanathii]|uniref:Structural maintenance of chromosomes protein 6 n=1 Tax=Candida viswanathii TaxID=5486 RepID=A0A367YHV6_9ASCO|nr:Structural maintenance of chromosomes protein 6 [Candida viswanathii]
MTQLLQSKSDRKRPRMMTQAGNGRARNGGGDETGSDGSSSSGSDSDSDSDDDDDDDDDDAYTTSSDPARAGVIEKLSLKNFMCHDSFELELGPQLNFIIGRNGSGKSAILTGISVGLGANATDTNRGSSIKDLIKDGKSTSRITIVIKNEGPDAYKPNAYGDKIIVERRLQRLGANTYTLKAANGKTVSHKKSDLDEMLYKFSITIDNPLAFLSQDKAREFLTSSTDKDKYEYFMDGAFITDILNNYSESANSVQQLDGKIQHAAAIAQKAKKEYKAIVKVHNRHRTNDALRRKLQALSAKIHWFNVFKIERVMEKKKQEIESKEGKLIELQSNVGACDEKIASLKPQNETLRQELEHEDSKLSAKNAEIEHLRTKRSEVKSELDINKEEAKKNVNEIELLKQKISNIEELIKLEQEKIDQLQGGSREALNEKLESITRQIEEYGAKQSQLKVKYNEFKNRPDPEMIATKRELASSKERMESLRQQARDLERESSSQYAPWGSGMRELVRAIKSRTDWVREPTGPVGSYVQVKREYSEWKPLLSTLMSKTLDAFIVTTEADRTNLDRLLRQHKVRANIIVRRTERLNFESGKADPSCTTVLDMLDIQSDTVLYALIDGNSIEKTIIAESAEEARRISYQNNTIRQDPVYYLSSMAKFGAASKASKLRSLRMKFETEKENQAAQIREINRTLEQLKRARSELEDQLEKEADYSRISAWQTRIEEHQRQISISEGLNESMIENINGLVSQFVTLKEKIAELKESSKEVEASRQEVQDRLVNVEAEIQTLEDAKKENLYNQTKLKKEIKEAQATYQEGEQKLAEHTAQAEEYCARDEVVISAEDTVASITEDFKMTSKQLEEAESDIGSSLEQVLAQLERAKEESDKAEEALATSDEHRLQFLNTTIRSSIGDAQRTFEKAMSLRGFEGTLKFDFNEKALKLQVNTGNDAKKRTYQIVLKELKRYPKSQNIFITPQDIAVVGELDDKGVKIHRMSDPRND